MKYVIFIFLLIGCTEEPALKTRSHWAAHEPKPFFVEVKYVDNTTDTLMLVSCSEEVTLRTGDVVIWWPEKKRMDKEYVVASNAKSVKVIGGTEYITTEKRHPHNLDSTILTH